MLKKRVYKIKWGNVDPEVLQRVCTRWRKRGFKTCCIEWDDYGDMWLVEYVRTRFKFLSAMYAKMVVSILKFESERLEEEEGWQDEKNYI